MSIRIIQDRLDTFSCQTVIEEEHAVREITQEVILSALGRTDFFKLATFHGETSLRIFYGLNRFSEDLDFCLQELNPSFELAPFLLGIADEIRAYGFDPQIQDRSKTNTAVKKAFIKDDSIGKILQFDYLNREKTMRKIKIKIEIDTNPPAGGESELKYLDFPFVSSVVVHNLSSLFAGKIHALLCRGYLKGRDWYDFIWYSSRKTEVNTAMLSSALNQNGPWAGQGITVDPDWCRESLRKKIEAIQWKSAAEEVSPFIKQNERASLNLWSKDLFLQQLEKAFPR